LHFGSDDGARMSFVWEETAVPGENPYADDLTFPHTTLGIEPGSHS